jgi:transcriptional regulator with XRE-family HTH domain
MVKKAPEPTTISGQLRQAIQDSGRSLNTIAKESGVDVGVLSRFVRGERIITSDTLDKVAAVLGLKLTVG